MDTRSATLDPSLLDDFSFFDELETADVCEIVEGTSTIRIAPEDAIFCQRETAARFYFLLNGHMRVVWLNEERRQVIARHISPRDVFEFAPALGKTDYPATAFASNMRKTVVKRLDEFHDRVTDLVNDHVGKNASPEAC